MTDSDMHLADPASDGSQINAEVLQNISVKM